MSLPYFSEFGWKPIVLAVDPAYVEGVEEPLLLESVPSDMAIYRVRALPVRWTHRVGVGDLGVRAFPFLYKGGAQIMTRYKIDLVYFSTTIITAMALGPIWKKRYRIPFVVDLQDPLVNHYLEAELKPKRSLKYRIAQHMNRLLEPWVMRKVDGIIAVSEPYHVTLRKRYPWICRELCATIPFGAAEKDFDILRAYPQENRFSKAGDGYIHGLYVGRGGRDMKRALRIIFKALLLGLDRKPELFSKVHLYFVGTDYAPFKLAQKSVEPVAAELGVEKLVHEYPQRVAYFEALQLLSDADFLLVPGSDDPQYTASKIYPYIMARKPLLAIFHERSSVVEVLRSTEAGEAVTFSSATDENAAALSLFCQWVRLLQRLPYEPHINWQAFLPYTAREMTRRQCELFDHVVAARLAARGGDPLTTLSCPG